MSAAEAQRRPDRHRCLVLNSDFRPLSTWPLSLVPPQEAVSIVYRQRAIVVDSWPEAFYRSPSTTVQLPRVIALRDYVHVDATPKFCRRSILLRDRFRCQFCGNKFASEDLTFDHVVPRARGGQTTWTNILTCCVPCNARKRAQPADWSGRKGSGLRPLKEPRQPTTAELLSAGLEHLPDDVRTDFGSWLYWTTDLRP